MLSAVKKKTSLKRVYFMKKIALIGSTGSIGKQVLNVVRNNPDKFSVASLAAGNNLTLFTEQVKEFKPLVATAIKCPNEKLPDGTEYCFGETAFKDAIISEADVVVVALVGFSGIIAVKEAIDKGLNIALANKESIVAGGELIMPAVKKSGITLAPIDSEHSAVWQALGFNFDTPFKKIILTASGGALRDYDAERLKTVTFKEALSHPNWNMGSKITVDCATLINKGLEVIEAKWLYNTSFDKIDVVIHRESIIHSMVEFNDNAIIAQLGYPSMETPISLALSYPERLKGDVESVDFVSLKKLSFESPDVKRFPCFSLAVEAGKKGGLYPAVLIGADDAAVKLFSEGKIGYCDIYTAISGALDKFSGGKINSFDDITEAAEFARRYVESKFGV